MAEPALRRFSFAEYLRLEAQSETKNEYFDHQILAMAGGTVEHAFLAMAVGAELRQQLRGKPCQTMSSDARIRAGELVTYPDVSIICGAPERDPEDSETLLNPTVIVEVLSKSTEAYDRGEKFDQYQQIPSLRDYVLVNQRTNRIEHFERGDDGRWTFRKAGPGQFIELASIGCRLSVDAVYEGVEQVRS